MCDIEGGGRTSVLRIVCGNSGIQHWGVVRFAHVYLGLWRVLFQITANPQDRSSRPVCADLSESSARRGIIEKGNSSCGQS